MVPTVTDTDPEVAVLERRPPWPTDGGGALRVVSLLTPLTQLTGREREVGTVNGCFEAVPPDWSR